MAHDWKTAGSGYWGNPKLSSKVRMQADYQTRLIDIVDPATEYNIGKKSGDKVAISIYGRITTLGDSALGERQRFPRQNIPRYEVQATVSRRGLAVDWTETRETLFQIDERSPYTKILQENAARTNNKLIRDAVVEGRSYRYTALTANTYSFKTDGTAPTAAAHALNRWHLIELGKLLKQYNVPTFDGETYPFVISAQLEADLLQDVSTNGFVDVAKYAANGAADVMKGEIGKAGPFRFIVDNDQLLNGSGYGEGFIIGGDGVKEAMVNPLEILMNDNVGGQFGQEKAMAWTSFLGYSVPWNYATHGQGSVLHYESKA